MHKVAILPLLFVAAVLTTSTGQEANAQFGVSYGRSFGNPNCVRPSYRAAYPGYTRGSSLVVTRSVPFGPSVYSSRYGAFPSYYGVQNVVRAPLPYRVPAYSGVRYVSPYGVQSFGPGVQLRIGF